MGLTHQSVSIKAVDSGLKIKKRNCNDKVVALAGNPNVGKSTVFNGLTGLNQHTGNWPGKTVASAQGYCSSGRHSYVMVDIPGTYSLMAHSAEEEVARNFICFGESDATVVVCDATCLERNLNLVLQTIEISPKVILCVNLMDEAKRKGIHIDLPLISKRLGIPAVATIARKKKSLAGLLNTLDLAIDDGAPASPFGVRYPKEIESAISILEPVVRDICEGRLNSRWLSLKILEQDEVLIREVADYLGKDLLRNTELKSATVHAREQLLESGINQEQLKDLMVASLVTAAEEICCEAVTYEKRIYNHSDLKLDQILTSRLTGYPIMLALLAVIFWLTITGANYPSWLLSNGLFWIQERLTDCFQYIHAPEWLHGILVLGVYRVLAWVVSVMLPPLIIFFPLFTLLEDVGYLPRIAYNLDKPFKCCCACGKQALTMCMVFIYL